MSLRSPLGTALGLGSAKSGHEHWWRQRVTAVALVPLGMWFALSLLALGTVEYSPVFAWAGHPLHAVLLLVFLVTALLHSSLGLQVVVEDYVHHAATRIVALIVLNFGHVLLAAAGVYALLKISLGGRP